MTYPMNAPANTILDSPPEFSSMNPYNIIVTHTTVDDEESAIRSDQPRFVTRGMMRERAVQLAVTCGRLPHEASKADWEAAKREVINFPNTYPMACCG